MLQHYKNMALYQKISKYGKICKIPMNFWNQRVLKR